MATFSQLLLAHRITWNVLLRIAGVASKFRDSVVRD